MEHQTDIPKIFYRALEKEPEIAFKGLKNGKMVFLDENSKDIQESMELYNDAKRVYELAVILKKYGYKITKVNKKKSDETLDE